MIRTIILILLAARAAAAAPFPAPTATFRSSATTQLAGVLGDYPWRHDAEINAVAWSRDGRLLTAGGDHRLRLWDAASGEELRTLPGVKGRIYTVAFMPDGLTALTTSSNGTLVLWDLQGGPPRTLAGHAAAAVTADVSADGRQIVSGGRDRVIKVWDAVSGDELHTFALTPPVPPDAGPQPPGPMPVLAAYSGREILVVTADGSLLTLAAADGAILRTQARTLAVDAAAFSPDHKRLAIAAAGSLHLFATASGDEQCTAAGAGAVDEIDFDHDGQQLASVARDGTLSLWDPASCAPVWHVQAHAVETTSASFSPDGARLVTASRDYTFKMWDLAGRREVTVAHGHARAVTGVAWAGDAILSTSLDGSVRVWDPVRRTGEVLVAGKAPAWAVAGAPGADLAVTAGDDGRLHFLGLRKRAEIAVESAHPGGAFALAMSADGARLISGGRDGQVRVWDVARHHRAGSLPGHSSQIDALALDAEGRQGVTGDDDGRVRLIDAARAQEEERLPTHAGPVLAAAIAPGGALVVTGSEDGDIRVDDRAPKHRAKPLIIAAHTLAVTALAAFPAFAASPHERYALSGSLDGTLAIWNLITGDLVDRIDLTASGDVPLALAIARDGRSFLVGTRRGVILEFTFTPPTASTSQPIHK